MAQQDVEGADWPHSSLGDKNREIKLYCLAWPQSDCLNLIRDLRKFHLPLRTRERKAFFVLNVRKYPYSYILHNTTKTENWNVRESRGVVSSDVGRLDQRINLLDKIPRFYLMFVMILTITFSHFKQSHRNFVWHFLSQVWQLAGMFPHLRAGVQQFSSAVWNWS